MHGLKYFSVVTLGVCACLAAPAKAQEIAVRVASFNVEFSRSTTPEQVGEMFQPYNLDIIGFDEVPDGDWTARVGKVLGMKHYYVGKISSANHKDKYKSILCRTPLRETKEYPLRVDRGWNPASAVRAVTEIDGLPIAFYSLHICASGRDNGHAYQLASEILPKESVERVIVVGDYNNKIGDEAMNTIENAGMKPSWKDLKLDLSNRFTYNALDPMGKYQGRVIDHILYNTSSGASATDGSIIELDQPLSDHKPIWANLVFPRHLPKR
ncbi:Endonuclease/Exonuclease/phosphatase family protein [Bremerella volcania]|uniref:Endonuclease/Exonuclease/phosphatase family protein n=1 Tax=Bremerella volcania TaxID=2527984 RepID=A0A518CAM2_9BACT|nr:endonuclease/exonuclease/phosphatase family protein [Bremerella volcania]QDU76279.1 Endonuclease/Exonuclease/phosphatase family protein [Bremerella volcania]